MLSKHETEQDMKGTKNRNLLFIFDVDGCIVDSFNHFMKLAPKIFEKFGVSPDKEFLDELQEELIKLLAGRSSKLLILKLINHASKKMGMGFFKRIKFFLYLKKIYKENIQDVQLIDGAIQTFKELKRMGHEIALFTTGSLKDFKIKFKNKQELLENVSTWIVRDNVKKMKPDPEGIFLIQKRLSFQDSSRIIMVGDMIHDIQAGIAAKCWTIGVLSGINTRIELESAGADLIFDSIKDIIPRFMEISKLID
ncbi:MAG: HAD family hydrolase [Promethearchaeota archaeon]